MPKRKRDWKYGVNDYGTYKEAHHRTTNAVSEQTLIFGFKVGYTYNLFSTTVWKGTRHMLHQPIRVTAYHFISPGSKCRLIYKLFTHEV